MKLTQAKRDSMPKSEFAGPAAGLGPTAYPVGDPTHARLAISGAAHAEHVGNISPAQEHAIQAKARARLGENDNALPSGAFHKPGSR